MMLLALLFLSAKAALYGLEKLDEAMAKALDRQDLAGVPSQHVAAVYLGKDHDWIDQWGYCKVYDHRLTLMGKFDTREKCIADCDIETWIGREPTACEYNQEDGTCVVFWGNSIKSSQSGHRYRCAAAIPAQPDYLNGGSGSYRKACTLRMTARGCKNWTKGGPSGYTECRCAAEATSQSARDEKAVGGKHYMHVAAAEEEVGGPVTWTEQTGWCVNEIARKSVNNVHDRQSCLDGCAKTKSYFNDKPDACEYSASKNTCAALWGYNDKNWGNVNGDAKKPPMKGSGRAGNYMCNLRNTVEVLVGGLDSEEEEMYRCGECEQPNDNDECERISGCMTREEIDAAPKDQKNCVMSYSGDISRTNSKDTYGILKDNWCRTSHGWMRCGGGALCCKSGGLPTRGWYGYMCSSGTTVAMAKSTTETPLVVTIFAAIGLAITAYGAFKHYTKQ